MADPVTVLAGVLVCTFTTASVDGRAAFDSTSVARAEPVADAPGLVMLGIDDLAPRPASIQRTDEWLSLRGAVDPDHGQRVAVLDVVQAGPQTGEAVLVVMDLDGAARVVTRRGTCQVEDAE